MCASLVCRIVLAMTFASQAAQGRENSTAKSDQQPICSSPAKSTMSGGQIETSLNRSAAEFLNEASCPSQKPAGGFKIMVNFDCSDRSRPSGLLDSEKVEQTWIPVPPQCFHAECPMNKFTYPAGCGKKKKRSTPCAYSASMYFAMNVLDVYVDMDFPPNGTWSGFAIDRVNTFWKGPKSWDYATHKGEFGETSAFAFRATTNNFSESENKTRLSIHRRYFVPVQSANSSSKVEDDCFELAFPTVGFINQTEFNASAIADSGPEAVTLRKFCVRECPLGSAIPEASTAVTARTKTLNSPASTNSSALLKSKAAKLAQHSEALRIVALTTVLVVVYGGR